MPFYSLWASDFEVLWMIDQKAWNKWHHAKEIQELWPNTNTWQAKLLPVHKLGAKFEGIIKNCYSNLITSTADFSFVHACKVSTPSWKFISSL
jgi:hypothetical protein